MILPTYGATKHLNILCIHSGLVCHSFTERATRRHPSSLILSETRHNQNETLANSKGLKEYYGVLEFVKLLSKGMSDSSFSAEFS